MNSEYWLGREVATWNDAQVIVDTNIFIKNIKKNPMKIYEFVITKDFTFQASCKAIDSRLVEIESEAEDVFVRALAMKLTGKTIFYTYMQVKIK